MPMVIHDGRTIFFRVQDIGKTVLPGHGFLQSREMWKAQVAALPAWSARRWNEKASLQRVRTGGRSTHRSESFSPGHWRCRILMP